MKAKQYINWDDVYRASPNDKRLAKLKDEAIAEAKQTTNAKEYARLLEQIAVYTELIRSREKMTVTKAAIAIHLKALNTLLGLTDERNQQEGDG